MRNGLRMLIVGIALLTAPAPALAQFGDPVPLPFMKGAREVRAASSGPAHAPALIVEDRVHYADASGRWRSFGIAAHAVEVRLARLEDGGGLAAWDDEDTLYVRTWTRDGVLAPPRAVMSRGYLGFELAHDEAGTVVLATAGDRLGVIVRDPGGAYTVPQDLGPASADVAATFSAVVADGNVSVSWDGRRALRTGRAPAFEPAPPLPADPAVLVADGSRRVRVGPAVRKACADACEAVHVFTWADGTTRLVYRDFWTWYIARPGADGTFGDAVLATRIGGYPVWTAQPGIVAFTRESFPGFALLPYGVTSPRRPTVQTNTAFTERQWLTVYAHCRTTCRMSVKGARITTLPLGQALGRRALEPFEVAQLVLPRPRGTSVRLTFTLRDARGRTTRKILTLRRGTRREGALREWVLRR